MSLTRSRLLPAKHILLRGFPAGTSAQDVRRLIAKMDIKGVSEVSMLYKHFRPTGKAVLTMALPDYITPALRAAQSISLPMCEISAEVVPDPEGLFRNGQDGRVAQDGKDAGVTGNGSSAGVPAGRTVTIYGFNGRTPASQVLPMLKGFRTANDQKTPLLPVPLPDRKFSLVSRFTVFLESESEAQRFVRKYHMTHFQNSPSGPLLRAFVIN